MVSKIDEKDSSRFHKSLYYYHSLAKNYKLIQYLDKEKVRLHTNPQSKVTNAINTMSNRAQEDQGGIFAVLRGIYKKNQIARAKGQAPPVHKEILSLIEHPDILILAYKKNQTK